MKLRRETQINASAEKVWNVLGPKYTEAYLWASSVNHSRALGDNGRLCDTEIGEVRENLEVYDEQNKEIAYTAKAKKMPFFIKRMENRWKVNSKRDGTAHVFMELNVRLSFPFNILMALPMRMQLGGILKKAHEELKYYVEHDGKAHPRKLALAKKFKERLAMTAS